MIRNTARWTVVGLSLCAALVAPHRADAQTGARSDKACSLLTASELEQVMGGKLEKPLAGMKVPYTKDANHDHDGAILTCQGKLGARFVMVVYGTQPVTPEGRKRGEERARLAQEKLRTSGYTIKEKDFGDLKCWTMQPPANQKEGFSVFGTNCGGTRGDYFYSVSISATGAGDLIPIEKLKAVADKAASRLP
jgi:hypothetical protein